MSRAQEIMEKAVVASSSFRTFDQKKTDEIVRAVYLAALDQRVSLAKMAHEETGMGVWQHKVIKNVIASQLVYEDIRHQKTVGVIYENPRNGIIEVAQPIGPILGFIPVTNPTSTTIFKALICLKTRNPLIISPHQAARGCIKAAAELCYRAALEAGAPENCLQWLDKPSPNTLDELMGHSRLGFILATGTESVVRKASMSGKPAIGVGPGNVPAAVGVTADLPYAVKCIISSKTFDNGTVCASEQAVVTRRVIADQLLAEFQKQGAYILNAEEVEKVGRIAYDQERGMMTPTVVGQSVQHIAQAAGIEVPQDAILLIGILDKVGRAYPLSAEILAPILAFYIEEDFDAAIKRCSEITRFGGQGHTAVIHSNSDERIEYFSRTINVSRILVNIPSTFGAVGGTVNTLSPSFTLSCGSGADNITTDNITARHLLNIHRVTRRRPNSRWFNFHQDAYLDESIEALEIEREFNKNF
jgi:acetaldehyde dehydrogenase/alcohol dehydrogenase